MIDKEVYNHIWESGYGKLTNIWRERRTTSEAAVQEWLRKGRKVRVETENGIFDFSPSLFRIQKVYRGHYEFLLEGAIYE